jgi:glycyl-tRNA synthetase (class II)
MAEIEHYVDPKDKRHARFSEIKDVKLNLLAKDVQEGGETTLTEMSIGDAVAKVSKILWMHRDGQADDVCDVCLLVGNR